MNYKESAKQKIQERLSRRDRTRLSEKVRDLILDGEARERIQLDHWSSFARPDVLHILGRPGPRDDDDQEYFALSGALFDCIYDHVVFEIKHHLKV